MTQRRHYEGIVIGSGPGGEGAAMMLAKGGKNIAMVERYTEIGGGCTHWGTIPSKSLRHAVQQVADYRLDPMLRRVVGPVDIAYPDLLKAAESVIRQQTTWTSLPGTRVSSTNIPSRWRASAAAASATLPSTS